ncbi:AbrB/MazE/SpoVT family DNA-binding domain-containing protein [Krasilnikovia sp. M28-CT-15]|uniref:AbrB/MazE/SpoVT family DNA-binding domain-containing protein n=1 Tax=Krasilnikovia sp. M28-CT-15 TaxID=3373540 RepID=UPI0038768100
MTSADNHRTRSTAGGSDTLRATLTSLVDDMLGTPGTGSTAPYPPTGSPGVLHLPHSGRPRAAAAGVGVGVPQRPRVRSLLHSAGIATGPEPADLRATSRRRAPLPLVEFLDTSTDNGTRYRTVSTIDDKGRLCDRTPLKTLDWHPGTPVCISANPTAGIIAVSLGGHDTIDTRGRLRLPADLRHACRLSTGDRLLVVAHPAEGVLVAYLPRALDAMTAAYHATLTTKEPQ